MNPLSLRRARSHVAKPATIAAVAALAISAMAGTAVPASAQSDASTPRRHHARCSCQQHRLH